MAKIIITGDTHLGGGRVRELALNNDVENLFGEFIKTLQNTDLTITNLESPVIDDGDPIFKTGPHLKSPKGSLRVLKNGGFNILTLANNHIMDYGDMGLSSTLRECEKFSLDTVGAGLNADEASETYINTIAGLKIAVINFAENEFGTTTGESPGAHSLNTVRNYYTIRDASKKADRVIVIIHGGHEYYPFPSPEQKEQYRFFADAGANIIAGHHPHCFSGYEVYNDVPIFYSLGNFLFDHAGKQNTNWNQGYMVELDVTDSHLDFQLIPYIQGDIKPGLRRLSVKEESDFRSEIKKLNQIIEDDTELNSHFEKYCASSEKLYNSYLEPHSIRHLHGLQNRNLFPTLISKRKRRLLLNLVRCEAHRNVLLKILSK